MTIRQIEALAKGRLKNHPYIFTALEIDHPKDQPIHLVCNKTLANQDAVIKAGETVSVYILNKFTGCIGLINFGAWFPVDCFEPA